MKTRCLFLSLALLSTQAQAASVKLMMSIMQCESSLRFDVWGDDGKSFGIAQFRKETFYEFAKQAEPKMKRAGYWPPRWRNPQHQVYLLGWALDHGFARRWTCYRKIVSGEWPRRSVVN